MSELDTPLELRLPARTAKKLAAAGLETVGDLLELAPRRYYHWGRLTAMRALRDGEDATILAQVASQKLIANRSRPGVRLEVVLTDGVDQMRATFFASNEYKLAVHRKLLRVGEQFLFAGKVGTYRGHLQLTHPEFEGADGNPDELRRTTERPIPIYPAGKGLTSWVVGRAIGMLLDAIDEATIPDVVPLSVRQRHDLPSYAEALVLLHRPSCDEDYRRARRTLAWQEAFVFQTALLQAKAGAARAEAPASPRAGNSALETLRASLPFELTAAQSEAIECIGSELEETRPVQRLLQADVGAGKTVVALLALTQVIGAGHQGAILAPTEVLAEQHFRSIQALLAGTRSVAREPHGACAFPVYLLTASTPAALRKTILADLADGIPCLVVGTHALLQEGVNFADLALIVVDEQHRFGVAQRDKLRGASSNGTPHQLVMTATPIPRTVAMTIFGDLEETRMEGLPPGRIPVATHLVDEANAAWVQRMWQRAREEIDSGGRVYVVCPRIDEEDAHSTIAEGLAASDDSQEQVSLASVVETAARLRTLPQFEGIEIATLTGRTPADEKAQIMASFASGECPLLVATTVVEVGVDVPQATMMGILDAQQFGLSQLHQLRGRVGRSARPALCMAVHRTGVASASLARLEAFASTTNGFELAEADVKLRREGDVLGADQSGRTSGLRHLSVLRDGDIIQEARTEAATLLEADPTLAEHSELRHAIVRRLGEEVVWMERS